jgi:hypothetical protein
MEHKELRGPEAPPTPEEFEEARQREVARLNFRVSSIKGQTFHTPEDARLLEGDSAGRRTADMVTVRRWAASSARHGGGTETT